MPPRVFCRKSAEVIENKGRESRKERKERSRVRKRKEVKEIEEVKEVEGEDRARFVRDNTRNGTIHAVYLSIVNLSPMVSIPWKENSKSSHQETDDPRVTSTRGHPSSFSGLTPGHIRPSRFVSRFQYGRLTLVKS